MSRRRSSPPANGRMSWDGRLWDRAGRQYEKGSEPTRDEAKVLLDQPAVQVAIQEFTLPLQWVEPAERPSVWKDKLAPRLHDSPA